MITEYTGWRRDQEGLGLWPHQGKVAIAGWECPRLIGGGTAHLWIRRLAPTPFLRAQMALEEAGVRPEEVDGLLQCPNNMAAPTAALRPIGGLRGPTLRLHTTLRMGFPL